jgi:hypothetical protein
MLMHKELSPAQQIASTIAASLHTAIAELKSGETKLCLDTLRSLQGVLQEIIDVTSKAGDSGSS